MSTKPPQAEFSLGFNFDDRLVEELGQLSSADRPGRVSEVFGALSDSPVSSARPMERIPSATMATLTRQAQALANHGIAFNYLMNTNEPIGDRSSRILDFLSKLMDGGVRRLTVGTNALATLVKTHLPDMHVTMSITRGVKTARALKSVADAGCDACYLDGVFVNRNFGLLTSLIENSPLEIRLYANMSCISACPVVRQHYDAFANQSAATGDAHDRFFGGCSLVKWRSPVEWIQMPWIRPEDIGGYRSLGVQLFKLSDRLAPTDVLTRIADSYTRGVSPSDLFDIVERSGTKYRMLADRPESLPASAPYRVDPVAIPPAFFEHFRNGDCISQDAGCRVCTAVASAAVTRNPAWQDFHVSPVVIERVPPALAARAGQVTP